MSLFPFLRVFSMMAMLQLTTACHSDSEIIEEPEVPTPDFVQGADISWVTEMEHNGHTFKNREGQVQDCYKIMKSYNLQAVRFRVWVNPSAHGHWCNMQDVLTKCQRAKAQHLDIMIDFHYSDWWADPGKQNIPAAWTSHTYEEMKHDVAQHTEEVLSLLKRNNIYPKWVQVGNETSNGFLWPMGQADQNPAQYAGLFKSGYEAVKRIFPETEVIVHLDNGANASLYNWNLDILKKHGAKWDLIGLSVYPYWSMQSGNFTSANEVIEKSIANMRALYKKYQTNLMVVETGMECADGNGKLAAPSQLAESKRQLQYLLTCCKDSTDGHCKGVFYWEPECKPSKYRLGAFTEDGRPTQIMDAWLQ